jgi:predicted nucleic acid-binding protein
VPARDYLIAAAAAERGFAVLQEDRHFDTLAQALGFQSVRLSA